MSEGRCKHLFAFAWRSVCVVDYLKLGVPVWLISSLSHGYSVWIETHN